MQAVHASELFAIVKGDHHGPDMVDHKPVGVPNTLSKIVCKAVLLEFQGDYVTTLMPRQLAVGVKFTAELLIVGLRMTFHAHGDFVIIGIDLRKYFNKIWRSAVLRCHLLHASLEHLVRCLRAKLGPIAPMWVQDFTMWHDEVLLQGGPIAPSFRMLSPSISIRQ